MFVCSFKGKLEFFFDRSAVSVDRLVAVQLYGNDLFFRLGIFANPGDESIVAWLIARIAALHLKKKFPVGWKIFSPIFFSFIPFCCRHHSFPHG